jgi:hypothetical protein
MTAWSTLFGLTLLAHTIGWQETRKLMHRKKKQQEEELAGVAAGGGADVESEHVSRLRRVRTRKRG